MEGKKKKGEEGLVLGQDMWREEQEEEREGRREG